MIKAVLNEGRKIGFSTTEVFKESIKREEFENFIDYNASHEINVQRVIVRSFWDYGDPVGFCLFNPHLKSIKEAFQDISTTGLPDQKENYAKWLPRSAKKVMINLFDESSDMVNKAIFHDLLDRINEILVSFPGLKLNKIRLAKTLKKVYIANSFLLNIKYKKTNFHLVMDFIFKNSRIEIGDTKVFFKQLDPFKIISRAFNLLGALTDKTGPLKKIDYLIMAPEASAFILKEFSSFFMLGSPPHFKNITFPSVLNIVDNPILDQQPGSVPFDDEGCQGGERFLLKKGIPSELIADIQSAFRFQGKSSCNGFRDDRNIFPVTRFSNLYIKSSVLSLKNLMGEAGRGILVVLLKLKYIDGDEYYFSANGYRFEGEDLLEPVHFYFKTTFYSYFLNVIKVSKEIKFFHSFYNVGSPYLLVATKGKSGENYRI